MDKSQTGHTWDDNSVGNLHFCRYLKRPFESGGHRLIIILCSPDNPVIELLC